MEKKEIIPNQQQIAYCGLYCGACSKFLSGKCPGCHENIKASWCSIRTCCMENKRQSCADCTLEDVQECGKFNNLIGRIFGVVFNSNRAACIQMIREKGYEGFAIEMSHRRRQSLPRK